MNAFKKVIVISLFINQLILSNSPSPDLFSISSNMEDINDVCFIILGASGDLTRRSLIPSLYSLFSQKKLTQWACIGAALPSITKEEMLEEAKKFIPSFNEKVWEEFAGHFYYIPVNFTREEDFQELNLYINNIELMHNLTGNRLFYYATATRFFEDITANLCKYNALSAENANISPWHRVCLEKPLGHDLCSSQQLKTTLTRLLNENQIFCIDYFLNVPTAQLIKLMRTNFPQVESIWNTSAIERIEISCNETLEMEGRGALYDAMGVLDDVVQNHLFQLLMLAALESPAANISGKASVLKNCSFVEGILGQYKGYHDEKDVKKDSNTPTYTRLTLSINTPRWAGVPFIIEAGKGLEATDISVKIYFKSSAVSPFPTILRFNLAPIASITWSQITESEEETVKLIEINHPEHNVQAYSDIFQRVVAGDRSTNATFEEIEYSWRIIDEIKSKKLPLYIYDKKQQKGNIA